MKNNKEKQRIAEEIKELEEAMEKIKEKEDQSYDDLETYYAMEEKIHDLHHEERELEFQLITK